MTRNSLRRACRLLALLGVSLSRSVTAGEPTEIRDVLVLERDACTLTILGGDRELCYGTSIVVTAELTCDPGSQPVNEPQWSLDGNPLGSGYEIEVTAGPGKHVLLADCGACQSQILVDVSECPFQPVLDAAFANEDAETSVGILLQPNLAPIAGPNFAELRFLMRPITLSISDGAEVGSVLLDQTGEPVLELYRSNGQAVPLPAVFDVTDLPQDLLLNATAPGNAVLTATYSIASPEEVHADGDLEGSGRGAPTTDELLVRVAQSPGLGGEALGEFPWFHFVDTFNDNGRLEGAVDPFRHRERENLPYRAYVVAHRSPAQWAANPALVDVSGGFESSAVASSDIQSNTIDLWTSGLDGGTGVSRSYDIVYDFGLDGTLDPGDLIDGLSYGGGGAYIVRDLTLAGPYTSQQATYTGGSFLGQRTYYPSNVGSLGLLPLIVISHGNGHNYQWYDYLGQHLASHGFIVMSHQNNTMPGIETASTTTLTNTDYFLGNLATIAGGVLQGHVDDHRIIWIGHSRGGEGVVRAYDRVLEGNFVPAQFIASDVILVCSIAPTVYLAPSASDPHEVGYYLIVGGADGDVSGGPDEDGSKYFRLSDRARGTVMTTYIHGADHNDFNCCGVDDGVGPGQIERTETQQLAKSYFLAICDWYGRGNRAGREFFTRMYDDLRPRGVLASDEVSTAYRELNHPDNFVVDDFQSATSLSTSSSGGTVTFDVSNLHEGPNEDINATFTWTASDPMNGMTFADTGDFSRGAVFDYTVGGSRFLEFEIVPGARDLRTHRYLSFRACQGTRHPETVALASSHSFSVTLRDGDGTTSTVHFGAWGKLTPLYQRSGEGTGVGWTNEMNTVRVGLWDFETNGSGIDLANIAAIRLQFGGAFGSSRGRIGLDDLQLMKE